MFFAIVAILVAFPIRTQPDPASVRSTGPSVRIEAVLLSGETLVSSGWLRADSAVVTTLGAIQGAQTVRIVLEGGAALTAKGVADYRIDVNLALLTLEGTTTAGPRLDVLKGPPDAGLKLAACLGVIGPDARRTVDGEVVTSVDDFWVVAKMQGAERRWGGSPVVTDDRRVVGVVTGLRKHNGEMLVEVTRAEIAAALKPGPVVSWFDWPETRRRAEATKLRAAKALALAFENENERALEEAAECIRMEEGDYVGWWARAQAYMASGDKEDALQAYDRADSLLPTRLGFKQSMAIILTQLGRREEAAQIGRKLVEMRDPSWVGDGVIGLALNSQGKSAEAAVHFRRAVGSPSCDWQIVREYEGLLRAAGKQKEAEELVSRFRRAPSAPTR